MSGETKTTSDHEEIQRWAQDRGGTPACVHNPLANSTDLRIDFLHEKYNDDVRGISWEEFFRIFDQQRMVLVYQTETEGGKLSRFGRIVKSDNVAQALIE